MNDLLEMAIAAHGGLERWSAVNTIDVDLSITGAIWHVKGRPNVLQNITMQVHTDEERVAATFADKDMRTTFEPDRVVIEKKDGTPIESRSDPERSFKDQPPGAPWDDVHVAYFSGEALWTYLNTPFLYTRPGFVTEEIGPIEVGGEKWRRLKVIFPDSVKSHTREQISCFGPDGLLRRHDYTVDILGGATGLNFASDYTDADGIMIAMRRRVYAYEGDYQIVKDPVLVAIDISKVTLSPRPL
jgi:hypothetical protein